MIQGFKRNIENIQNSKKYDHLKGSNGRVINKIILI